MLQSNWELCWFGLLCSTPWPAFVLFEQIYNLQAISREADMCNLAASDAHLIDYFHRDA